MARLSVRGRESPLKVETRTLIMRSLVDSMVCVCMSVELRCRCKEISKSWEV